MRSVVGLDVGHSAVKCVAIGEFGNIRKRESFLFPSVAIPAISIADEFESERATLETVMVNGDPWFFGRTAEIQSVGNYATGLTHSWIESKEYSALFLGAIKRLKLLGMRNVDEALFVLGLPTNQQATKRNALKQILGRQAPGIEILVAPQPMGALQCDILSESGAEKSGRSLANESIAVIEIGYFTTDFLLLQHGTWTEQGCNSTGGVKMAAERLSKLLEDHSPKITADLRECQDILISRQVKNFGKVVSVPTEVNAARAVLISKIIDEADRLFAPVVRKLTKVIVAGGGAPLVIEGLSKKWPHVEMIQDYRMAIADGFCRMGTGIVLARERDKTASSIR